MTLHAKEPRPAHRAAQILPFVVILLAANLATAMVTAALLLQASVKLARPHFPDEAAGAHAAALLEEALSAQTLWITHVALVVSVVGLLGACAAVE
ncbi:MAG: hypothetical protein CMI16_09620 [Opitutaceae bacterium]|nr:hypothetical protein [Opitutaceae bacterium]|tara:strand:- start:109 stop:396 length:288 start_codon:yes stop_codon:yes gene_type:complete